MRESRRRLVAVWFVQLLLVSVLTPVTFTGSAVAASGNDIGYHFDESSSSDPVTDYINTNDGTASNSPGVQSTGYTDTTGDWGSGYAFDFGESGGNDGDEQVTAPIDLENHDRLTVSAWIKTSDESTHGGAVFSQRRAREECGYGNTCGEEGWVLWLADGDHEETEELVGVIDDGNGPTKVETGRTLADGSWHHVAMTYDGSSIDVYVDGTHEGSASYSGEIKTRDNGNFDHTYIGVIDGAQRDEFDGLIDEPVILPRALDSQQLSYLKDTNRIDESAPTFDSATGTDTSTITVTIADNYDVDESSISASDFSLSPDPGFSVDSTTDTGSNTDVELGLDSTVDSSTVDVSIANTITDSAGNLLTSGTKTANNMDGVAPTLDGATKVDDTTIDVDLSDSGAGFDKSTIEKGDFNLDTGSISSIDTSSISDGDTGTKTVTLNLDSAVDDDTVTVSLQSDGIDDLNGNTQTGGSVDATNMDGVAPTLDAAAKVDETTIDVDLSDSGAGFDKSTIEKGDFSLDTGSISSIDTSSVSDGDTGTKTVTLNLDSAVDDDTVTVSLQSDGIDDLNGNTQTSGSADATNMDGVAPTLDAAAKVDDTTIDADISDGGSGIEKSSISSGDFSLTPGSITSIDTSSVADGNTGTQTVTINLGAVDSDTVTVDLQSDGIDDKNGNTRKTGSADATGMDSVAPSFTSGPSTATIGSNGFDLDLTADEDGTAYYVVVSDGSGQPTTTEIKNGNDATGGSAVASASSSITSGSGQSFSVSGLSDGTAYDSYVLIEDSSSNTRTSTKTEVTTTTDTTAPSFTSGPSTANVGTGGFDLDLKTDEGGTAYYVVVGDGSGQPSVSQVKNGKDSNGDGAAASGSGSISAGTSKTFSASGLSSGTAYDSYVVVEDTNANTRTSSVVEETTATPAPPPDTTLPTADAGPDRTVNVSQEVTFDASGSSDNEAISSHAWTFPFADGLQRSGETTTYTFDEPGEYTAELTVTDTASNTATDSVTITVQALTPDPPVANLSAAATTVSVGESVTLDAGNSTIPGDLDSYGWDLDGDGSIDQQGESLTHRYETPGNYTVQLRVTDTDNQTATDTTTITVTASETGSSFTTLFGVPVSEFLPMWQASTSNIGYHPGTSGPSTDPGTAWEHEFATGSAASSDRPIIADGRVFTVVRENSGPDSLRALDRDTGSVAWTLAVQAESERDYRSPGSFKRDLSFMDGRIYARTNNGTLWGIDAKSGEIEWSRNWDAEESYRDNSRISSATPYNGSVYLENGRDSLVAVDAETGSTQWTTKLGEGDRRNLAWLVISQGTAYAKLGGTVYAVDAATGSTTTSYEVGRRDIVTSPTAVNGTLYSTRFDAQRNTAVVAYNATTGEQRWTQSTGYREINRGFAYVDGRLYVHTGQLASQWDDDTETGVVVAYDAATGDQIWETTTGPGYRKPVQIADGVIYTAVRNNSQWYSDDYTTRYGSTPKLLALDAQSGDQLWTRGGTVTAGPPRMGTPAIAGDKLFYPWWTSEGTADTLVALGQPSLTVSSVDVTNPDGQQVRVAVETSMQVADLTASVGETDLGRDAFTEQQIDSGYRYTATHTAEAYGTIDVAVEATGSGGATAAGSDSVVLKEPLALGVETERSTYSTAGEPVAILSDLTLTGEGSKLGRATVSLGSTGGPGDRLHYDETAAKKTGISGNYSPTTATLTFSGTGTPAEYQSLLQTVRFETTAEDPRTEPREVRVSLQQDGKDDSESLTGATQVAVRDPDTTPPTAIAGGDITVEEGTAAVFDGSKSSDNSEIASYIWQFGDGTSTSPDDGKTVHVYDQSGTYEATLTVRDEADNTASDSVTVTVQNTTLVADAGLDTSKVRAGEEVQFDATASVSGEGISSYEWDFGGDDEIDATRPIQTVVYEQPGEYETQLRVTDRLGTTATTTTTVTVVDSEPPTVDIGPAFRTWAEDQVFPLSANVSDNGKIASYAWDFQSDETTDAVGQQVSHQFADPGTYLTTLTVTDTGDNRGRDTTKIKVRDTTPPEADAGPDVVIDQGESATLNASGSTDNDRILRYGWDLSGSDAAERTGQTVSISYDQAGTYPVTLVATDPAGNTARDVVNVTVRDATPPNPVVTADRSAAVGEGVRFNASGSTDNVGIGQIRWDFQSDGNFDTGGPAVTHQYPDGQHTATVQVVDESGNIATETVNVTVFDTSTLVASAGATNDTVAADEPLTLDATSSRASAGIESYTWDVSGRDTLTGEQTTVTFVEPGTESVGLRITDAAGNTANTTLNVTVRDTTPPKAVTGTEKKTVDVGETVSFDATGSTDNTEIASYEWDIDSDGTTEATGPTPTHTYKKPGSYTVTLTVTDRADNTAVETRSVTVRDSQPPSVAVSAPDSVASGESITLDATGSTDDTGIASYAWDLDDDGEIEVESPTATTAFETAGTHTVSVTVTDEAGNAATTTATVNVTDGTPPTADAGSSLSALAGSALQFDASNSTDNIGIASYEWDFGDGTTATGETVSHTYENDGRYKVELTTTDEAGNTATDSLRVPVVDGSVLIADAGRTIQTSQGEPVSFDATTSTGQATLDSYTWDFDGDGETDATGPTPTHTYETAGRHTAVLTVTDTTGTSSTDRLTVSVADTTPPTASATVGQSPVAEDTSVSLSAAESTDNTGIERYEWDLDGDGVTDATGETTTHRFDQPGTYEVGLTTVDGNGNTATDTVTVVISDVTPPTIEIDGTTEGDEESALTFDANGTTDNVGIASYEWDFDGDNRTDATGVTATYSYEADGNYTVALTATDESGNEATDTTTITVEDNSTLVADAGGSRQVGPDTTIEFDATGSRSSEGISSYEWDFDDGTADTGAVTQHAFLDPGTYDVTLTVTDAEGATATDTTTVQVEDVTEPTADLGGDRTITAGSTIQFDASDSQDDRGIDSYTWQFGDGNSLTTEDPSVSYYYGTPGTYPVTLTTTDNAGNTDTDVSTVEVRDESPSTNETGPVTVGSSETETESNDSSGTDEGLRIDIQEADREESETVTAAQTVDVQNAPDNSSLSFTFSDSKSTERESGSAADTSSESTTNRSGNIVMDRLDMGVERGGDFDLQVESRDVALARRNATTPQSTRQTATPTDNLSVAGTETVDFSVDALSKTGQSFVRETGSRPTGYIQVNHSVAEEEIGTVAHHFRVRKSYLNRTGVGPESVALYRQHGDWNTLETRRVGETADFYHYEAVSPGLSLFTIGARTPAFDIQNAQLVGEGVTVGKEFAVNVTVANVGRANGTYTAELVADGEVVTTRTVALAANTSRTVQLRHTFTESGDHSIAVGSVQVQSVGVQEAGPAGSDIFVWFLCGLTGLLLIGLLVWRRRDGPDDPLN